MVTSKTLSAPIITGILLVAYQIVSLHRGDFSLLSGGSHPLGEAVNAAEKPLPASLTISEAGIGPAKLGMTIRSLKQALGGKAQLTVVSPYQVDFDALVVSQGGKVQYRIIDPAGTKLQDSDRIELLMTDNSTYKTAQGVGAGMSLKQAEGIYGKATLFYNVDNESREGVIFAKQPSKKLLFVPKLAGKQFAGISGPGKGGYFETPRYQPGAVIGSVWVRK